MLTRRGFLALAGGLLMPVPEPVRAYSFLNPAWMPPREIRLTPPGIEGQVCAVHFRSRATTIRDELGTVLFTRPAGDDTAAEFVVYRGKWQLLGWGPPEVFMGLR